MLLLAAILWGGSYAMQKIMADSLGTFSIIFIKGFSGFLMLFFCFIFNREFSLRTISAGILVGLCNGTGLILQQLGLTTSNVSKVSFISGLYIIFVPLFMLLAKKKPKNQFWVAVIIACAGIYLLCMNESFILEFGDLITLVSTMFFALQIIFIHKYSEGVDFVAFCGIQQATVATISGIIMLILEKPEVSDFGSEILPSLYVMFASGLVAQLLQNKFHKDVDPNLASLIMSLESVFGALSGVLLLGTTLSPRELAGCAFIFVSILIAQ